MTRKLFYGLEASWLGLRLDDQLRGAASVDAHQRDNITRSAFDVGLGYAFRPRVVLSIDVAGGFARAKNLRTEDATGSLVEDKRQGGHFVSANAALQGDVWRQLFVSGSFLVARQWFSSNLTLYADRFGRFLTSDGSLSPNGLTSDRAMNYYSEFSAGWRFTPQFLAQYVLSTDYGFSTPSHTLLLRYTFRTAEK